MIKKFVFVPGSGDPTLTIHVPFKKFCEASPATNLIPGPKRSRKSGQLKTPSTLEAKIKDSYNESSADEVS